LRGTLYSHVHRLSLDYHDNGRAGDLFTRLTADVDAIESFITSGLLGIVTNILTLVGMIAVMLCLSPKFTGIALSVAPILLLVVFRFTRSIKKASREVRKREGEMASIIQEVLSSIRVVKAYASEEFEKRRLSDESKRILEAGRRARTLKVKLSPLVDLIVSAGVCLVLWYGGKLALRGAISAGSLVLFTFYLGRMYKPMREISKLADGYSKAAIGYERILEVMESNRLIEESEDASDAPRFRGKIEFVNVDFSYQSGSPILRQISFSVEPGQTVALVGPTGAGKTSIVNLIPRFYDPDSGSVKIDGADVKTFRQRSLRQQMSLVLQDTVLFHGPVWFNIAYGKPEATRAEVVRAAALANADEFIQDMPQGYDTIIGERGVTLSGGQRQRIAIARAVIRNAPILILDEVTGLDPACEALVFEALQRLMRGRTSIVIAHRLATVQSADVIFVVKRGAVVESGNHEALLRSGGVYSELCRVHFCAEAQPLGETRG
jgi:subfamily B ATP-binding cassette protein MsbA